MKIEFNMDSPLWRFFEFLADLFVTNVLFIITSIPIVTIGASITAMDQVFFRRRESLLVSARKEYLQAFKENFKQSTIIWLLYIVFVVTVVMNINATINLGASGRAWYMVLLGVMLALLSMEVLYALAMTARFKNNLKDTLIKAFLIGVGSFPYTITIILMIVVAAGITIKSYSAILIACSIWFTFGFGLIGYVSAICFLRGFRRFTFKEDIPEDSKEEEMYRALEADKERKAYLKSKKKNKNKGES